MKMIKSLSTKRGVWFRLFVVRMTLRNIIYISYALPAETLQPLVSDGLHLATIGDQKAFVSLVALQSTYVRLTAFPVFRFHYFQFNIRTYVIDPVSGQPAVYFLRSGVTSRFISLVTGTIGIPWEHIEFKIDFNGSGKARSALISGNWEGNFSLKVKSGANAIAEPSLFQDWKSTVDFLIRPLIGISSGSRQLMRFTIRHPEVNPQIWSLENMYSPLFNRLVPVDFSKNLHSVFYLPETDFSIYLPPERIIMKG